MAKYLIDANLPYYFGLWNNSDYVHVKDIDDTMSDDEIWEYAKNNHLIIITKDADFSLKVLSGGHLPKVIHLKFGNLKMNKFHELLSRIWSDIEQLGANNTLVNVYSDRIEAVK